MVIAVANVYLVSLCDSSVGKYNYYPHFQVRKPAQRNG